MNNTILSKEEALPLEPEQPAIESAPSTKPVASHEEVVHDTVVEELTDADIVRMVDEQMGGPKSSEGESRTTIIAFGVNLIAFLFVGILILGRYQPANQASASTAPVPRWISWTYSLEEGQARARKNHSKILIDFYTDWCPSCKWVDSTVYTRPDVLAESRNVTMVKINAEGRRDLAQRYNITVYPSFVWTDENGNVTARHEGSTKESDFAPLMAQNR
ncbi:thioredoxin [bacterium]|nr:MAG: thioredoxin [bacterium]